MRVPTSARSWWTVALVWLATASLVASCSSDSAAEGDEMQSVVYQLQGYTNDRLDEIAQAEFDLAIVDLARDAGSSYFTAHEIRSVQNSGTKVLAYFEIGGLEDFRPDFRAIRKQHPELFLNEWEDWPGEFFGRYWEQRWWELVIRPRLDQALAVGFDGVYLDTPLAYEEIDLGLVPEEDRDSLGRKMVKLIERISQYTKERDAQFWVFPQNSPELRHYPGYTDAIDGIGIEDLFFIATDKPCAEPWCAENLDGVRALRDAGKIVVAIDYAVQPENIAYACRRYQEENFIGYVTVLPLDTIVASCDHQ